MEGNRGFTRRLYGYFKMSKIQGNGRMFFRKNWKCRNRTTRITQNSQLGEEQNHLFASCFSRNQENQHTTTMQAITHRQLHF